MAEIETLDAEQSASDALSDEPETGKPTRRGRVRKWDRPRPPHDWRWYVGNLGKALIAIGLLMFGFVAYQLYGTAFETAAAQSELEEQFDQQLALVEPNTPAEVEPDDDAAMEDEVGPEQDAAVEPENEVEPEVEVETGADPSVEPQDEVEPEADPAVDTDEAADSPALPDEEEAPAVVPVAEQNLPDDLQDGDALAKIEIPRIGVNDIVVAGVEKNDLKKGPGHFPDTPLPGQLGNSAIAGHRTTYGQPFRNVDKLEVGDEIRMTTLSGVFVYKVTGQAIVSPSDYQVVATTDPTVASLTLTSCHPVFSARQRIVIFSELDRTESAPVGEPVINYGRPEVEEEPTEIPGDDDVSTSEPEPTVDPTDEVEATVDPTAPVVDDDEPPADRPGSEVVNQGIADAFSDGWFSDPSANTPVGVWGAALGAIALASYAISRRFRRDLVGLAVGIVPFSLALYFFFQNVNRLLPPNL